MTQRQVSVIQRAFWWDTDPVPCQLPLPLVFRTPSGRIDSDDGHPPYDRGAAGLSRHMQRTRAYATRAIESGYLAEDRRTQALIPVLRQMRYDDALYMLEWRVELLYLSSGAPHFRLFRRGRTFGVAGIATSHADLTASRNMADVRRMLAAYLVFWNWDVRDVWLVRSGALTPLEANTDHQYRLFKAVAGREVKRCYDVLSERSLA